MTKSNISSWTLILIANFAAIAGAAYFVSLSGKPAGVIPALMMILLIDIQACRRLLKQPSS